MTQTPNHPLLAADQAHLEGRARMTEPEFDLDNLSPRDRRLVRAAHSLWIDSPSNIETLWPLTKTIPTVRQGPSWRWYRQGFRLPRGTSQWITGFETRANALSGMRDDNVSWWASWPAIDAPTVAALLLLPLTEEVPE